MEVLEVKENKIVRTTIDLPANLHEKILAEADKEKRSRHSQMVYALEKFFETPNGDGKREKTK